MSTIDDTLDVFPCHGVGGLLGMLATGVFATQGGLIRGETRLVLLHLAATAIVSVFSFGGAYLLFKLTDWMRPLRVDAEDEEIGLDLSQHDEVFSGAQA